MSFLEKEEEKPSTFWDWAVGIGLLVLVGGFILFYQYQKRSSMSRFQSANVAFEAGKFQEAAALYEDLKGAQYLTTANDSLIYSRLDSVESMQDREKEVLNSLRSKLVVGDTEGIRAALSSTVFQGLLSPEDQAYLDSIKSKF